MDLPRVGLDLTEKLRVPEAVDAIVRAEARGVPMVWSTIRRGAPDAMTFFAAGAVRTSRIGLGTAVVPTYPRHPAALASQALAVEQLAPGRFRLGIGPSHRPVIENSLGIPMDRPLAHLREYLIVLRALLWEGAVDFEGRYFSVHLETGQTARVPIYISALRANAYRLAGELADGAISWMCPADYLRETAAPAMAEAAQAAGRATPRLVAHVPVAMTSDRDQMLEVARPRVGGYARLPFYAAMFADAGFPVDGGVVSDDLLDHLVVWGDEARVQERLAGLLGDGIDELLVMAIPVSDLAQEEERLSRVLIALAN